jgi:hypothetical protein
MHFRDTPKGRWEVTDVMTVETRHAYAVVIMRTRGFAHRYALFFN